MREVWVRLWASNTKGNQAAAERLAD